MPDALYPSSSGGTSTYSAIMAKYDTLMANPDTLLNHDKKMAQRWMKYVLPKYNIEGDTVFNNKPYNDAIKAFYQGDYLCQNDAVSDWQEDGPLTPSFLFGSEQPFRGWIDAVCVKKDDPDKMVIGTRTSGFFKTIDGGDTWDCVTDNLSFPVLGCRTMLIDPDNSSRIVAISGNIGFDGSVLYSDDFGDTWTQTTQVLPTFQWIDYHPTNHNILFACSEDDIYYSPDKGITWSLIGAPTDVSLDQPIMFEILVSDNFLWLVSYYKKTNKVYWHKLSFVLSGNTVSSSTWSSQLNHQNSPFFLSSTDILNFVDFSNKVGDVHYVQVKSNQGNATYKTVDGGATYNKLTSVNIPIGTWWKNEIIVSPNNSDIVYWGSVLLYPATNQYNDPQAKRFNTVTGNSTLIKQHATSPGHHDDYRSSHIISVNGKDHIAIGHDGGLGIIPDGLNLDPRIHAANGDLSNNLLHTFDVHERTGRTVYAYQDGPMFYRDADGTFSEDFLWECSAAMVQKLYPDAIVGGGSFNDGISDKPFSPHEIVYQNNATGSNEHLGAGACYLGGPFITYHHYPNRFAQGLMFGGVAMNRGVNNSVVSYTPTNSEDVTAVAVCARKPQFVYSANLVQGDQSWPPKFQKSINDGVSWTSLENATVTIDGGTSQLWYALTWNHIKSIAVDPEDENTVYFGIAGTRVSWLDNNQFVDEEFRVIKSVNGGNHFDDFSQGLPALPVDEIITVESDNHLLFCATAVGIFYRYDGMTQWECFSTNLPKVEITALKYDYCNNMLYASTYGRGLWKTEVGFDVPNTYEEEITTNTTWSTDRVQCDHVLVKSGVTLTITAKVEFYKDKKITVEPGAWLNIHSGGHLTSYCNSYWQGIVVLGQHDQPQNAANQGRVFITNGGIIENAREAIMPWKYGDWTKTGGIIHADNAIFRNNNRSIQYMAYQNTHPINGAILNNLGSFHDCTFEWTDALFDVQPRPAITMNGVKGVQISGCTFQDLRTNITDVTNRARGIFTIDAGYSVRGSSVNPPTHDYYDDTDYDVCEFINLYKGIENLSGTSAYPFLVDHCSFLNCQEGIAVGSVDNAVLTRNHFDHGSDCPSDITYSYNMYLNESSGFNVQGNVFENTLSIPNIGVTSFDVGVTENEIRRNRFFNQRTANGAFGRNANDQADENFSVGLQFLCNESTGSLNDMFVFAFSNLNEQGVRLFQGATGEATLNKLSQNLQTNGFHFRTSDQQNLKYYWENPNEEPTVVLGDFTPNQVLNISECPSDFDEDGPIVIHDDGVLASQTNLSLTTELSLVKTNYEDLKSIFENELLAGDASALHNLVDGLTIANRAAVKQDLLDASPYLSIDLLTELGAISSNIFPHKWFQHVIEANAEVTLDNTFRTYLTAKSDPMPTAIYDAIITYAQNNNTQRGLDMMEIGVLSSRIAKIENLLLADLVLSEDLADQNEIPVSILNRNNYMKRAELIDHYMGKGDIAEATNQIDLLEQELPAMPVESLNKELEDFIVLKEYIIDHLNAGKTLNDELSPANIDFFKNARDNFAGRASYQASNILCFYANMCEMRDPMNLAVIGRSQGEPTGQNEAFTVLEDKGDFVLYPNPNEGTFVIKGMYKAKIDRVEIQDIQGKVMSFGVTEINDETLQIDFNSAKRGTYIVRIWNLEGEFQNIRILKN